MTAITVDRSVALFKELQERIETDGHACAYAWLMEQELSVVALALTLMANA